MRRRKRLQLSVWSLVDHTVIMLLLTKWMSSVISSWIRSNHFWHSYPCHPLTIAHVIQQPLPVAPSYDVNYIFSCRLIKSEKPFVYRLSTIRVRGEVPTTWPTQAHEERTWRWVIDTSVCARTNQFTGTTGTRSQVTEAPRPGYVFFYCGQIYTHRFSMSNRTLSR